MADAYVKRSSCVFSIVMFFLLSLSVGILVFILKSQAAHESASISLASVQTISAQSSSHRPEVAAASKIQATPTMDIYTDSTVVADEERLPWEDFRLPRYAVPLHYDLMLHPNLENDTFDGSVKISVALNKSTRYFVVHAYRLLVLDAKVFSHDSKKNIGVKRTFVYDPNEYFVVETNRTLEPDVYQLHFTFAGSLVGSIVGFYKSRYKDAQNQTHYLATSKFQPTYARRAFPCFDEPSFKSTFGVSLVHQPEHIALSNMPALGTEPYRDNWVVTHFEKSHRMVTYLACFIVCDFSYKEDKTSDNKKFRVYSTPNQANKTDYALGFGLAVLEYFENYFDLLYPLPKQDMVAIPDFASGAMEHWGIITFRETNLLHDPERSSPQNIQRISTVISHEMAHMWFGNLVTMEWWDDLWLNEGFASYIEYKGVHHQHPDWDMLSQFVTEEVQSVMDLDSTMSSHPILQKVTISDEISEIFDDISYGKGASILRMLEFFIGQENFQRGISQFLKKYSYGSAKTSDLWQELSQVCGYQGNYTISSIMKTWTEQMGFPYVTIERSQMDSSRFTAKQQRFVKNKKLFLERKTSDDDYQWIIPLSYLTSSGKSGIIWIDDNDKKDFTLPVSDSEWVKFNVNQTGYYLVNYDENEWQRLTKLLKANHEVLSPTDRSNLLFDAFLLAEAGHIKFDVFLSMSLYLKNETHLVPWETAHASFIYLCQLLESSDVNNLLKRYVQELTASLYEALSWRSDENHLDNLLRTTIIGLACHSRNQDCLSMASQLFENWTKGEEIPSALRNPVYHYGMAEIGNEQHWNYMWNRYLAEESPLERKTLLYGLAHIKSPYLIQRYLEHAMDDSKIRRQDFFSILSYIAGNPVGRPLVWKFLRDKWSALVERFTLNNRYLGLSVKKICSHFSSDFELQQMQRFFSRYPNAGAGKRGRQQALEKVQNNIKWLKSYKQDVKTWLQTEGVLPWYYHRLPSHVRPTHYEVTIHPRFDQNSFDGFVTIWISLNKPSDVIILHALHLNITKTEVTTMDNQAFAMDSAFEYEEYDYFVIKLREKLELGSYRLYFEFEGKLGLDFKGLFKSTYLDPVSKEKRHLAATQFEPMKARRAFPCFDEPDFKATFSMRLRHNSSHFALSNTEVEETVDLGDGFLETRFEKTLPMATYLVAFVICDFEYKETMSENGIRIRVYVRPQNINKTDYALEAGSKILTFFENYFGVPFPLKKLDMIGIPGFEIAMENWGLVTYSEAFLLWNNETSLLVKKVVADTVAHELAHMWFGDLVTMQWWNDLWLNEGFANYIGTKGVQYLEPSWDIMNTFSNKYLFSALVADRSIHSHPIVQRIEKRSDADQMFDKISYSKGASLLRMLENFMDEDFRQGLTVYLKKYAFKNTRTEDLWSELSAASKSGLNVSTIMDTWTKQMNYPSIRLTRDDSDENYIVVEQIRFLINPESKIHSSILSPYNYVWQIPLTYRTDQNEEANYILLNSSKAKFEIPQTEWIKLNVNMTGLYLVNYPKEDWIRFTKLLRSDPKILSTSDRYNLIFDSFSLAYANQLDYEIPLNLTFYLKRETDFEPWHVAKIFLYDLKYKLRRDQKAEDMMKEHIRTLAKDLLKQLTWNDTGSLAERNLRRLLVQMACDNEDADCLRKAKDLFGKWMSGEKLTSVPSDLVYFYGMQQHRDEATWEYVWQKYLEEDDVNEKRYLVKALANVRNFTLLERLMDLSKNTEQVRIYLYLDVLEYIAENPMGHEEVVDFLMKNWTNLNERYPDSKIMEHYANLIFRKYDVQDDLKKVEQFYKDNPNVKYGKVYRAKTIESIRNNIRWLANDEPKVVDWLNAHVYMPWKEIRLPKAIKPTKYDLKLRVNITEETFQGRNVIELNVSKESDTVILHQNELDITETKLRRYRTKEAVEIYEVFPYHRNQFWVVRLKKSIPPGFYSLELTYNGRFRLERRGFRRYFYVKKNSEEKIHLAATKFEPTGARTTFPCFDEPNLKARFTLTLVHEANYSAVSNMPVKSQNPVEGHLMETKFLESVPMSTYLVCWIISDYDYLEADYKGKKIRTYAPPDRVNQTAHALNMTVKILEFFEDYFDEPFVLPKLDSFAVPAYSSSAMENWGLIVYQEQRFVLPESIPSRSYVLTQVDQVIAHELAHQWFGNLVTMEWWNDIWLNEGLSTFAKYFALEPFYPDIYELQVRQMTSMLCEDVVKTSHPIIHNVSNPYEITFLFDQISYKKGAAVLRMLEFVLKEDFQKGIQNYIKKYAYKNAETKDLWKELTNASKKKINVSDVMNTWTRQMGFPLVEIERRDGSFVATQQRFLERSDGENAAEEDQISPFGYVWKIPLHYKNVDTGEEHIVWLNSKNATFQTNASKEDVLVFNPEFVGYYLINYGDDEWAQLSQRLQQNHQALTSINRYALLYTAFLLADEDRLLYDIPMELTKYLKKEHKVLPWKSFNDRFRMMYKHFEENSEVAQLLKEYVKDLTSDLFDEYVASINNKSALAVRVQEEICKSLSPEMEFVETIVSLACFTGNEKCLSMIREELKLWTEGENITASLSFVLRNGAWYFGDEELWNHYYREFVKNETEAFMKGTILTAMFYFKDSDLINRTLAMLMSNETNEDDYVSEVLYSLAKNPYHVPFLWDIIKMLAKHPEKKSEFPAGFSFSYAIYVICNEFKSRHFLDELVAFAEEEPNFNPKKLIDCQDKVKKHLEWTRKHEATLLSWLQWNVPK